MSGAHRLMPRYLCHKEVRALKITGVRYRSETDDWALDVEDEGFSAVIVERAFIEKHQPQAGGYYVAYEDGYTSFSPGDVFEKGYTRVVEEEAGS